MDDPDLDGRLERAGERFRARFDAEFRAPDLTGFAGRRQGIRWGTLAPAAAVAAVAALVIGVFWVGTVFDCGNVGAPAGGGSERGGSSWDPDLPAGVGPAVVPGAIAPINEQMSFPAVELGNSFRPRADIAAGHPYCLLRQLDLTAELVAHDFAFVARIKPGEEPCRLSGYSYFEFSKGGKNVEVLGGATDPAAGQWPADPLVTARRGALTRASVSDWCGVRDLVDAAIFFGQGSENETRKVTQFPPVECPVAEPTEEEPSLPHTYWQPEGWAAEPVRGDFSGLRIRLVDSVAKDYPGKEWDGTPTWVVELAATKHDIDLDPCPGYQVALGSAGIDDAATWRLNCQQVPTKRADGTPYLRKGEPVRFAIWVTNSRTDSPLTLRLILPGGNQEISLTEGAEAPTGEPRLVDEDEANLHLYVSNQSFDEPRVPVSVSIDGVVLVDEPFDVEGQHNWQAFPIAVGAGTHEVVVTGPNGATTTQQLVVPQRGDLWAVTNYWTNDRKGSLDWMVSDRPIGFA